MSYGDNLITIVDLDFRLDEVLGRLFDGDGEVFIAGYGQGRRGVLLISRRAFRELQKRGLVFGIMTNKRVWGSAQGRELWQRRQAVAS